MEDLVGIIAAGLVVLVAVLFIVAFAPITIAALVGMASAGVCMAIAEG